MKNLLWLASYPKSGNTWMRIFLANLQKEADEPMDINALGDYWANNRELFNNFSGLESSLLTDDETLHIRYQIYEHLDEVTEKLTILKTHAPYLRNTNGERLFPKSVSLGVIYLIRDPLDIAISMANHNSSTLDEAITLMADETYALFANKGYSSQKQLFEPVSSWGENVLSWVEECEFPLLIIRYEDLVFQSFESFSRAAHFAGLSDDPNRIKHSIDNSSFDVLQKQEQANGFREKPKTMGDFFFRKGKVGAWREELSPAQVERIIHDQGEVMRRFGYLTEDGIPVY
jgi:hypothetical protein